MTSRMPRNLEFCIKGFSKGERIS